jgi:hypothetical protein
MEVSSVVEPVPTVEIGDIDHQRVSVPTAARVSIVEFDRLSERRPLAHVDDALHVVIFEKPYDVVICRRLEDLIWVLLGDARDAGLRATRSRIEVFVIVLSDSADRSGPGLIGNLAIRRIHDHGRG